MDEIGISAVLVVILTLDWTLRSQRDRLASFALWRVFGEAIKEFEM